ncbi:TetR/AcrR family transcriptional regulator, partial [Cellulomonas septica]
MGRRPGRPRATGDPHEQRDTRQDVLDAAAALFCTVGYAATSTRAVADRAGVRQASIYHHFASKDAILLDLLLGSVRPSLELADRLATAHDAPPAARLWALAHADVLLLTTSPVNVGALYLLPEVDGEQFAEFHALRDRLRARYDDLAAQVLARPDAQDTPDAPVGPSDAGPAVSVDAAGPLVLGLVESVILRRRTGERLDEAVVARSVADGVLLLLGSDATTIAEARAGATHLLPSPATLHGDVSATPAAPATTTGAGPATPAAASATPAAGSATPV